MPKEGIPKVGGVYERKNALKKYHYVVDEVDIPSKTVHLQIRHGQWTLKEHLDSFLDQYRLIENA